MEYFKDINLKEKYFLSKNSRIFIRISGTNNSQRVTCSPDLWKVTSSSTGTRLDPSGPVSLVTQSALNAQRPTRRYRYQGEPVLQTAGQPGPQRSALAR